MINYNTQNWKECLESLGFTEVKNDSFGGIMILDDKDIPQWQYNTEEEKKILYHASKTIHSILILELCQ